MPCVAHIFNLAVQDGLTNLGIPEAPSENDLFQDLGEGIELQTSTRMNDIPKTHIGKLLRRLRRMIVAIKMSPTNKRRYEVLCDEQKLDKNKLSLDCKTRWNSTLEMINKALAKKVVLEKMATDVLNAPKEDFTITASEWTLLEEFSLMLVPFAEATEMLSKSKSVSISTVMPIVTGLYRLLENDILDAKRRCEQEDPSMTIEQYLSLDTAYTAMITKLTKYSSSLKRNPVYIIATSLDPVQKHLAMDPPNHQEVQDKLLGLMGVEDDASNITQQGGAQVSSHDLSGSSRVLGKRPRRLSSFIVGPSTQGEPTKKTGVDEINEYFSETCAHGTDPLFWWNQVGRF